VFYYVSKYMGKVEEEEGCACPGRFWGVVNPKNIPLGERKVIPCTGQTGGTTDAVPAALRPCGDAAEISFQPLVHELHVPGGFPAGAIAATAGFARLTESIIRGRRRFASGHSGA
jgi:hypothetical protein